MIITKCDFEKNFKVHVEGTFWPVQVGLSLMPRGSRIITISDETSIGRVYPDYLPYVVAKGAVAHLTRALAVELGSRGIFINSIAPGPVLKTKGLSNAYWKRIKKYSLVKLSDEESVEEFAKLVLHLSAVKSTGSTYPLNLGD